MLIRWTCLLLLDALLLLLLPLAAAGQPMVFYQGILQSGGGGGIHANTHYTAGSDPLIGDLGFLTLLSVDNIQVNGNTIITTNTNGNLIIDANGTGRTDIENAMAVTSSGPRYNASGMVCFSANNLNSVNDTCLSRNAAGRFKLTDGAAGVAVVLGSKGSDIASANNITLGTANYFLITGTNQINTISATNWTAGSCIVLQFSGSLTVSNATAGTGAQIKLLGSANFSATADDTLTLCYDGSTWRETARTVI